MSFPSAKPMRRRQVKSGNVSICTRGQRSSTSLVEWQRQVAFTDYRAVCRWAEKYVCTIEEKFRDPAASRSPGLGRNADLGKAIRNVHSWDFADLDVLANGRSSPQPDSCTAAGNSFIRSLRCPAIMLWKPEHGVGWLPSQQTKVMARFRRLIC
jgi:hypothetical protein